MLRLALALCLGCSAPAVQSGDLVFHRSRSPQSAVIAEVTRSPWTHVGVVLERGGEPWVLEAAGPVRLTRLDRWRARGEGGRTLVRRLPRALSAGELAALRREGERYLGRPYDARFEWSDRRMYCSELVWKVYERALGVRLTEPERWSALALTPRARALARRRLGRLPRPSEVVVTPAALATSPALVTVR